MQGAIVIDKPSGFTSHDVVIRARRIIGERRIGHTGTLDPFATGVLLLLIGKATRLARFLGDMEKEYEAVIRLGYETDTADVTGKPIAVSERGRVAKIGSDEIEVAMSLLSGEIDQIPPMYSAKKIGGRRLYELARRGEEIPRKPTRVHVRTFELVSLDPLSQAIDDGTYDLRTRVVCSAGTYIRSLAQDLGRKLGTGAHVVELRRTRVGQFTAHTALTLDQLEHQAKTASVQTAFVSSDELLAHLPALTLDARDASRVRHGLDIEVNNSRNANWITGQSVRLHDDAGELLAIGSYDQPSKRLHPSLVLGS